MHASSEPIGVILAGGRGRRIGGDKASVSLRGRPLISYPLEALREVVSDVAVIVKPDTQLPSLPGVSIWIESEAKRHPLIGITRALALAQRRSVLVCAADLPFVSASVLRRLVRSDPAGAPAVIAAVKDAVQPLLGCYQPTAGPLLACARAADLPLREAVAAIGPRLLEVGDPQLLFNVNVPEDLLQAEAILDRLGGDQPNVKS